MATLQTLVDYALQQALAGGDQLKSALLDADMTMESLLQSVFQSVTLNYASNPDKQDTLMLLRRTHTVTLTNGVGALPDAALASQILGSVVNDPDDDTAGPLMSYTPWVSFVQPADSRLGYYSIRGDHEFYWLDVGESWPSLTHDGDVEVTIASVPEIPAVVTDQVDVPSEVFSDLVTALAQSVSTLIARQKVAA